MPQMEPLLGEVVHQRFRSAVGQHAADFALQHVGIVQLTPRRDGEQLIVRAAAPEEVREPRRQYRDRRRGSSIPAATLAGVSLEPEYELRIRDDCLHGHADSALEAAFLAAFLVVVDQEVRVGVGHRPAEGLRARAWR